MTNSIPINPELGNSTSTNNDQLIDFIHHKEELIAVYNALSAERLDYNERKWETIRTGTYLTIGFLGAIVAIVAINEINSVVVVLLGLLLIITSILIYYWSLHNVKRESELQFYVEFSIYQIEKLWTFHNEINQQQQWITGYPYLFDEKHLFPQFKYEGDKKVPFNYLHNWVEMRIKNHKFLKLTMKLNKLCTLVSIIVGIGLIFLAFSLNYSLSIVHRYPNQHFPFMH